MLFFTVTKTVKNGTSKNGHAGELPSISNVGSYRSLLIAVSNLKENVVSQSLLNLLHPVLVFI